jgi:HJR/Mrr/RecB family endonuclease
MGWQHFECLVGALWSKQGYDCYRTPGTNDNGVDIVALSGRKGQLVQAKTSGTDGAMLGWEAVKDVVTGEAFYQRRHPDIDFDKVCITNQFFNGRLRRMLDSFGKTAGPIRPCRNVRKVRDNNA